MLIRGKFYTTPQPNLESYEEYLAMGSQIGFCKLNFKESLLVSKNFY